MIRMHRSLLALLLPNFLLAFAPSTLAQVATGTPPFGSFGGGPDIINLANLNSHLTFPVFHKPGRGLNFNFDLNYDSSIWAPVTSGGTTSWQRSDGWSSSILPIGYLVEQTTVTVGTCTLPNGRLARTTTVINKFTYVDGLGTPHAYTALWGSYTSGCGGSTTYAGSQTAPDGSGYTLSVTGGTVNKLNDKAGRILNVPVNSIHGAATATDSNGNQISVNSSGVYTDTLGTTALTITGAAPSPVSYTYTAPSGGTSSFTVKYSAYTVQTNFGCSGVLEYPATSTNLISEIDLPDISVDPSDKYTITYETTYLDTHSPHYVTGRIASVTLPTGGTISYQYSTGGSGVNSISCSNGSAITLVRTTPDTGSSSWIYARTIGSGAASTTTITDPQNNQTVLNFQGIYETQRQVYQGTTTGTLLRQWTTCYNGVGGNCNNSVITLPITQRTVADQYGTSGVQCKHNYLYNAAGGLTEQDDYDYSLGTPPLLRQILVTFASLGDITDFRQQVTVKNGAGTTVAQTNYNYDETTPTATSGIAQHTSVTGSRGNLTSINYPVSGLTSHFTYYDTGSPNTSQDINLAATTYNYSSTNNAYCQMAFTTPTRPCAEMARPLRAAIC